MYKHLVLKYVYIDIDVRCNGFVERVLRLSEEHFEDYLSAFLDSCSGHRYDGVDPGTTESIPVLRNRFRYYGADYGITESIPVLRNRFRYYGVDSDTTESIPVLRSRFWYYGVDSGTTESVPVLQSTSRYCEIF